VCLSTENGKLNYEVAVGRHLSALQFGWGCRAATYLGISSFGKTHSNPGGISDEKSAEWNGHCCRLGLCRTRVDASERRPDEVLGRAISDIGAERFDGLANDPPSKDASSSHSARRERSRKRQHSQPTQRSRSRAQLWRRDGTRARASIWWPNKRLRSAEPNLRHAWGGATICQRADTG